MVLLKLRVVCAGCPFSEPPAALNNGLAVQQDAEMCFVVRPNIGKERGYAAAGGVEPCNDPVSGGYRHMLRSTVC